MPALAYCDATKTPPTLRSSGASFQLGNEAFQSKGKLVIWIPASKNGFIIFEVAVINAGIPLFC